MNIFSEFRQHIISALEAMQKAGELPGELNMSAIEAVPPREASHGDIATNAAMVLAGQAKLKPREIADKLVERLKALPNVTGVEIAGPGFINLRLSPASWQAMIPAILQAGTRYGDSQLGKGVKINVEYVSANPTGPIHVGHARGSIYGDALSSLLKKAGFTVTKEYYINDAGGQIDTLAESALLRYREALGEDIGEIPQGLYPGDYLIPVGKELAEKYGDKLKTEPREHWLKEVKGFVVDKMMDMIRSDLAVMGIQQDVFSSEQAIRDSGKVDEAVALLDKKGLIYLGVLEPPKGKPTPEDWEPREQTLFRSTEFGDDADRPIKKSDGSWAYFTPDIAYHYDKVQRGFDKLVDVFGADHGGYVKRIKAAVGALSDKKVDIDVKLCQMIKLLRGGEPAKMSKRAGTFVTARDMVEEVGKDVLRFIMLTRKNDAPLDFDFDKVMEQSKDNPVFYVQYAHARAKSVLRRAAEEMPDALEKSQKPDAATLAALSTEAEMAVIKEMASWPRMVEGAAQAYEPHRIAFYLHDLASLFHGLWNMGNSEISLRFIEKNDINATVARLALARALTNVIASGLEVLGVEPVEEMR